MMFEKGLEGVVLLKWDTTPEMREQGFYGLKDQITQASGFHPETVRCQIRTHDARYMVIGEIDESPNSEIAMHELEAAKIARYIDDRNLPLFLYDLFRQGYIGTGFYIVDFAAD